ncbi:hypothetical protein GCM10023075_77200 [Streptosporangium album]
MIYPGLTFEVPESEFAGIGEEVGTGEHGDELLDGEFMTLVAVKVYFGSVGGLSPDVEVWSSAAAPIDGFVEADLDGEVRVVSANGPHDLWDPPLGRRSKAGDRQMLRLTAPEVCNDSFKASEVGEERLSLICQVPCGIGGADTASLLLEKD